MERPSTQRAGQLIEMPMNPIRAPITRAVTVIALSAIIAPVPVARAQEPVRPPGRALTLNSAREMARRASPDLTAAREAVAAAAARERQAAAFPNPTLSYEREQTSQDGQTNSQNIVSVDQPVELGGLRGTRTEAARLRREVAEQRLRAAEAQLDYDVTRAYALAVAADRRAVLAQQVTNAFARARSVSQIRLVEGDVSGYANRRIRLEAARYAGLLAEVRLAQHTARITLASFLVPAGESSPDMDQPLSDSLAAAIAVPAADSLHALATLHRSELRVAALEAEAAAADARLATRERIPVPVLSAGLKNERAAGGDGFNGFVAGVSLPLPLWDRRRGAIDAASADARRRVAEADIVRRRVAREVDEAAESLRAVAEQVNILAPQLGAESEMALGAAQLAYAEGEITLVEWLDAVRAYQEAESTFASLLAESLIRLAALERAVGVPLSRDPK